MRTADWQGADGGTAVTTVAPVDLGGRFGHLVIALLEKYPSLNGILVDVPELIPVARENNPAPDGVAPRLQYVGQNIFEGVPPLTSIS